MLPTLRPLFFWTFVVVESEMQEKTMYLNFRDKNWGLLFFYLKNGIAMGKNSFNEILRYFVNTAKDYFVYIFIFILYYFYLY